MRSSASELGLKDYRTYRYKNKLRTTNYSFSLFCVKNYFVLKVPVEYMDLKFVVVTVHDQLGDVYIWKVTECFYS